MSRGFHIFTAVLGLLLIVAAGVSAAGSFAPPGWDRAVAAAEVTAAAVGVAMAWGGLVNARTAGDFDLRLGKTRRRRAADAADAAVVATELSFDCPGCGRTYRATGQMAGLPFACRACDARFTVPRPAG